MVKPSFQRPTTPRIEQDLVISKPTAFLESDNFYLLSLVLPIEITIQMCLSHVDKGQIAEVIISVSDCLSFPVELAIQISYNVLDQFLRCLHIPVVVLKEELESVNYVFENDLEKSVLQWWVHLLPKLAVSERLWDRKPRDRAHVGDRVVIHISWQFGILQSINAKQSILDISLCLLDQVIDISQALCTEDLLFEQWETQDACKLRQHYIWHGPVTLAESVKVTITNWSHRRCDEVKRVYIEPLLLVELSVFLAHPLVIHSANV